MGLLLKKLMDQGDSDRALPDCRRYPFDIPAPHISDCEHAREARLQEPRRAGIGPLCRVQVFARQVGPCLDEALTIEGDTPVEPPGTRSCPGHHEYMSDLAGLRCARLVVLPDDPLQLFIAFQVDQFGMRSHFDRGILLDTAD